tara:strand:+ start:148 stop:387 length:240 start_codon:yes stop_codon:yes gene_type:complete
LLGCSHSKEFGRYEYARLVPLKLAQKGWLFGQQKHLTTTDRTDLMQEVTVLCQNRRFEWVFMWHEHCRYSDHLDNKIHK